MSEIVQYSAAEGYIKLISELLGKDEEDILADKFRVALSKFFYKDDNDKNYEIRRAISKKMYPDSNYKRSEIVSDEMNRKDQKDFNTAYGKAMEMLDPLGLFHQKNQSSGEKGQIFPVVMGLGISLGLIGFGFNAPSVMMQVIMIFFGTITFLGSSSYAYNLFVLDRQPKVPEDKISTFLSTPDRQYEFLTEVFPAVLDEYLAEVGEDTVDELNAKKNELQKIVSGIHRNRDGYVLEDEEVEEITNSVKDRCIQIEGLILNLNCHVEKLESYKKETLATIKGEKKVFDKFQKTQETLSRLETIGIDIDSVHEKVNNWSAVIDRRLMDMAIEGTTSIQEAKYLLENHA